VIALVSRKLEGVVIKDRAAVMACVQTLIEDGTITIITGNKLKVEVQSILPHGDTPGAVELARVCTARSNRRAAAWCLYKGWSGDPSCPLTRGTIRRSRTRPSRSGY
jgi:LamB/YcsF family protein